VCRSRCWRRRWGRWGIPDSHGSELRALGDTGGFGSRSTAVWVACVREL